jgi:hypothetical protein
MAYADFTLSGLVRQFDLSLEDEIDLFVDVPEAALRPEFQAHLHSTLPLALTTATEKARSEFIIAPVLGELWLLTGRRIGVLSGVQFPVDPARGLVGTCDYIITRSPEQLFVEAPVIMLVEAKGDDLTRGYAQCVAEMLAAEEFNAREGRAVQAVYGVVTTGELWRFFVLEGHVVRIDARSYHIERLPKIVGILLSLVSDTRGEDRPDGEA